jgi:hypothetical protein
MEEGRKERRKRGKIERRKESKKEGKEKGWEGAKVSGRTEYSYSACWAREGRK